MVLFSYPPLGLRKTVASLAIFTPDYYLERGDISIFNKSMYMYVVAIALLRIITITRSFVWGDNTDLLVV